MKSFWTPARDQRLLEQQAAGRTAAEIAKTLGTTRSAVIGRSSRLRGIVYQSSIDSWTRANAKRLAEGRKRAALRRETRRQAIRDMARAVAAGIAEGKAMTRAHQIGVTWREIGEHFGISAQAAFDRAKAWRRKSGA